jgi:hypothetical protein
MGWITLYEASRRLQQKYPGLLGNEALRITEAAVRSKQDFIRGEAFGRNYREPIGDRIKTNDYVDVSNSVITDGGYISRWRSVEAQWEKFIIYVEEYLLPAWLFPKPAKRKQAKPQEQASRRKRTRRRGPARNTVGYSKPDAALSPEMERLITKGGMSATAAARKLVLEGKVAGNGLDENKAKRLAGRFLKEQRAVRRNSLKLTETR